MHLLKSCAISILLVLTMVVVYNRRILKLAKRKTSRPLSGLTTTREQWPAIDYATNVDQPPAFGNQSGYALISARIHPTLHISIAFVYSLNAIPKSASTSHR